MSFDEFKQQLMHRPFSAILCEKELLLDAGNKSLCITITTDPDKIQTQHPCILIPKDYAVRMPFKIAAMLQSRLGLNTTVFARQCNVKKIGRPEAEAFLSRYHLMGFTQSAYNYGLFYNTELVAVAAFSKGRKMNRLPEHQRSFELIRFCCKDGITVTGGLTKLVKNFCREKQAGDVMTYVDKQFSDGSAFIKAGFKKLGETEPQHFLVDNATFERSIAMDTMPDFDPRQFYHTQNSGNIKLIYTPID